MTTQLLLVVLLALSAFGSCGERGGKLAVEEGEKLLEKTKKPAFVSGAGRKAVDRRIGEPLTQIDPEALRKAAARIEESKESLPNEELSRAVEVQQNLRTRADELDLDREWAEDSRADAELEEDINKDDSLAERCKEALEDQIAEKPKALFCTYLKSYARDGQPPSDEKLVDALTDFKPDCVFKGDGAIGRALKNTRLWRKEKKFFNGLNDAANARQAFENAAVELACP